VESGGNASVFSLDTNPMLYTEVQHVSSVKVKSPCGGMELTREIKCTWAPCNRSVYTRGDGECRS
jgi:hypothetical protein